MDLTINTNKLSTHISLAILLVCSILAGVVYQPLIAFVVMAVNLLLLFQDKLYLAYPFILFYNEFYGTILGISTHRFFTMLVLMLIVFKVATNCKVTLKRDYLLPIMVYVIYSLIVVSTYSLQKAIFTIVDVISCVLLISTYFMGEKNKLKEFFSVYSFVALAAAVSGLINNNYMSYGVLNRFLGTLEDPNYLGFFYTVAVFAMITLKLFDKKVRWIMILLMYVVIVMSASMTAVIVNILVWLVYFIVIQKLNYKTVILGVVSACAAIYLYNYGLMHPDFPFLGQISGRIYGTIADFMIGDMSGVTTGRTNLVQAHLEYYLELPLLRMVFGGVPVNTQYIYYDFTEVAHNEYIDMLLNVGIIGTMILLGFFLRRMLQYWVDFKKAKNEVSLCLFILKLICVIYMITLTVFLDERFMLFFFI